VSRRRTAFAKAYVWWVKDPINVGRMREAAKAFVGMRDFHSFSAREVDVSDSESPQHRSTLVLIDRLDIVEAGSLILIGIEGSHFLWKMVRRMVGVLVEIGRGRLDQAAATAFLAEASEGPARLTAPPSGLFLDRVYYGNQPRDPSLRAVTPLT
jgi:tRNA pseudouridine38-40 synthase